MASFQKLFFLSLLGILLLGGLASCNHSSSDASCSPKNLNIDKNKDGKIQIGIATPGSRNDGAFYQSLVEAAQKVSNENCFEEVIVVDNISSAEAESLLRGLANQGVDFIAIGGTDIATPLERLIPEFEDVIWYCNCGSDYKAIPRLIQSRDDSSEINFSTGHATGLLLKRSGGSKALFLGCCDLGFERESFLAFEAGLKAQDASFSAIYIPTGAFPFDFNNIDAAVQALEAQIDSVDAVYPFLGAAHEPVIQRANTMNLITLSAGVSNVCERTDLEYNIAVRFDPGDYLETILGELFDGSINEGEIRSFRVGRDAEVGAKICNPTSEDVRVLDEIYANTAAGNFDDIFSNIKAKAYG